MTVLLILCHYRKWNGRSLIWNWYERYKLLVCPTHYYLLGRSLASSSSPSSPTCSDPDSRYHNLLCRTVVVVVAEDVGRLPRRCGGCCCGCCCDGGFEGCCVWHNHWSIVVVTGPFVVFELVAVVLDRNIKSTTVS